MLEKYFVRPDTVDRVRVSWIGADIERYVEWLDAQGYSWKSIVRRVPLLVEFGEFSRARGAGVIEDLPGHVDAFVAERQRRTRRRDARFVKEVRGPVEQMLRLSVQGFGGRGRRRRPEPFAGELPGFYEYLLAERGVRPATIRSYQHHLVRFEAYLARIGVVRLSELSPAILTTFVAERAASGLGKATIRDGCGVLRVFLRYAHREGAITADLSGVMDHPQFYRLSSVPRSITWEEVGRVLAGVDRRSPCGKRDWAILMLLVTYGLRP
jgi:integrase/recombinase XerD